MDKAEYMDEIQLIQDQNDTEFEIYPLVSDIIAPTLKGLSKRYVFARRLSRLGQIYYGISSFPDIAILDRDFKNTEHREIKLDNWKKLKGCAEVKAYKKKLYDLEELKEIVTGSEGSLEEEAAQLIGEILWYKNVLYTNGVQWKLFFLDRLDEGSPEKIIETAQKRMRGEGPSAWWKDPEILHMIHHKIWEKTITDDCAADWDDFIRNIGEIDWGVPQFPD